MFPSSKTSIVPFFEDNGCSYYSVSMFPSSKTMVVPFFEDNGCSLLRRH